MPDTDETPDEQELPGDVVSEAERLTRLAREAVDDNEARAYREARADLLADYDFEARVRQEDRDTLVLYPSEWVVDGTVHPDRIEDIDRGIEQPLEGPGEADEWEAVAEHNRTVAEAVAAEHGEVHGANAHAIADFASNHYAKPIGDLTREERAEFLTEYFPRNAFPSDDQKAVVEESVRLVLEAVEDVTGGGR
ncbi:MAG: rnhA operon protein [Haloarculaceae archaeon]